MDDSSHGIASKSQENGTDPTRLSNGYDVVGSTATNVADGFTMVAVGDILVSRALAKGWHPGLSDIIRILQAADVTFGNLETVLLDIRSFSGSPEADFGGAYCIGLPDVAPDLRTMGFNMVSQANNHTLDWGVEGMRETSRLLDANGIVYAGAGENLAQAGAARFLETERGRVALVSSASTFAPMARAGDPAAEAPSRPGLNPLRLNKTIVVPPEMLDQLARVRDVLPGFKVVADDSKGVVLAGVAYRAGEEAGYSFEPEPHDVSDITRNVRRGKQFSDFCIVTNHGHEPGNWSNEPADFEQSFARGMIDAGADAYIAHGPHRLRGIEIYRGRPIFYGLANFVVDALRTPVGAEMFAAYGKDPRVHTDAEVTVDEEFKGYPFDYGFTDPVFYESVIAVSKFENNSLAEIRLYPTELGHSERFANRGVPRLVSGRLATSILERLQDLSEPFGTQINIADDVGVISLAPSPSSGDVERIQTPSSV